MKTYKHDWLIDLEKCILWQYDKAEKLGNLIKAKQEWYRNNVSYFITKWYLDVFNIKTATDFGLSVWGKILNFPRQIVNKQISILNLSTEQYRFLLLGQVLKFKMNCTIPEINRYLRVIFNETTNDNVYVIDNHDMTITYHIEPTSLSYEIKTLIQNYNFLPSPAGVKVNTSIGNYKTLTITPTPSDALVKFYIGEDEYSQNSIDVESNTEVRYVVSADGYDSYENTVTVEDDVNIPVSLTTTITITSNPNTASISLTINGTTYTATGTITKTVETGDTYSYTVSLSGYPNKTGGGTISGRVNETINMVQRTLVDISNINNVGTGTIIQIEEITLTENCVLDIDIVGGKGWENDGGSKAGGRVTVSANFSSGDNIKIKKIKGVHANDGIGLGVWLNDTVILVAGGTGYYDRGEDDLAVGGSGYIGGKAEAGVGMTKKNGNGIISGTSTRYTIVDGLRIGRGGYVTYGGQGYVASGYTNTATASSRITRQPSIKIIEKY